MKDYFRNAPLLDFMAPTIKVQQIILPNVVDDVNFIARAEDGPLPDLPPGDRPEGLREVPAAVHDASEPDDVSRRQLAASDRPGRLHRLPRRAWGSRSASATRRTCRANEEQKDEWEEEYHWEEPHLLGLPDAADGHDRGVVRQVPQAAGLRPEGRAS